MTTETIRNESPTHEIIRGNWNILKGKLKQKYATLTDNDLTYARGKEEELLGRLEKVTGQERKEIERFIKENCKSCTSE
ncbi:MAG TPA: CsbD family protein [Opitutales bacterium]|jgi:uncharacterized protein YjbJ (UPF0337 family)|nr:CsbD family protein [Opitutales bacterium]